MSIAIALTNHTMTLRKTRHVLASSFQSTLATANAYAKERALKEAADLSSIKINDEDAIRAINRSIKQLRDTLAAKPNHQDSLDELNELESLLPKAASDEAVLLAVNEFLPTLDAPVMKNMGNVMAHLNEKFGAALNKGSASAIVKQALTK